MRDRLEIRAYEPVSRLLVRKLIVPKIYWNVDWPGFKAPVDVLAIDRAGTGEAHLVLIRRSAGDALALVPALLEAQAPFRWIAFLHGTEDENARHALASQELLYPTNTPGRIGVIEIAEVNGSDLGANIRLSAERFAGAMFEMAMDFASKHVAEYQFGD